MSHTDPILKIKYINRAILVYLLQKPLKLGKLIVLQVTDGYEKFSSQGKLLISSLLKSHFNVNDFQFIKKHDPLQELNLTYFCGCR